MGMNTNLAGLMRLKDYLESGITVLEYFNLINQVSDQIMKAQLSGLHIIFDLNSTSLNNNNVELFSQAGAKNLDMEQVKSFIKEITFASIFSTNQDCEKVTAFLKFIDNSQLCPNLSNIQEYCRKNVNNNDSQFVTNSYDETGVLDQSYMDRILNSNIGQSGKVANGVTSSRGPQLVSKKNGEIIVIDKESFWIGKGDVDLQIIDDTISRKHAVIIVRNGHYFICDNGSTNKTFVNNKIIPAKASVEIFDQTSIKFANIEYEFRIE